MKYRLPKKTIENQISNASVSGLICWRLPAVKKLQNHVNHQHDGQVDENCRACQELSRKAASENLT